MYRPEFSAKFFCPSYQSIEMRILAFVFCFLCTMSAAGFFCSFRLWFLLLSAGGRRIAVRRENYRSMRKRPGRVSGRFCRRVFTLKQNGRETAVILNRVFFFMACTGQNSPEFFVGPQSTETRIVAHLFSGFYVQ